MPMNPVRNYHTKALFPIFDGYLLTTLDRRLCQRIMIIFDTDHGMANMVLPFETT